MVAQPNITSDQIEKAANMLKAIAHPIRVEIMFLLKGGVQYTVSQIHESLGIGQSTTSHHLGILKDKGVLCSRREGKKTYYFLKYDFLNELLECMAKCSCQES